MKCKIKRKYYKKSKEILKEINKYDLSFNSVVIIHNIDNSFNIIDNNNNFDIWINHNGVLCEIIESLFNSNKNIYFDFQNSIKESL